MARQIDIAAIDRTQFKVLEEDGEALVIPLKDKHRWTADELHLRSLLLDREGRVLSAGFPKFFNLGEDAEHDRELAVAMAAGRVELPEKLDGSLIVADRIAGRARLRTRGRRWLGEFEAEVHELIAAEYPRLPAFIADDELLEHHSLMFELLSPARTIVLRPERAGLFLLGYVDKRRIAPGWAAATLARVAEATGVPVVPSHRLAADLDGVVEQIRGWKGKEGVVARFVDGGGAPRMIKIKGEDYLRLHAYRSRLSGPRSVRLAWLLGVEHVDQLFPALARFGLDWEAAEFARGSVADYLARRAAMLARFDAFVAHVEPWAGARAKADKRAFVDAVRGWLAANAEFPEAWWFTAAMRLFDGGVADARIVADANVIDEAHQVMRVWRGDPDAEVRAILSAPVAEDDG